MDGELSVRFITDGVTNVCTVPIIAGHAERPYDAELVYPCGDCVMTNGLGVMISARVTGAPSPITPMTNSMDAVEIISIPPPDPDGRVELTVSRREFAFWSKPDPARNGRRDPFFHIDVMPNVEVCFLPDEWRPLMALASFEEHLGTGAGERWTAIDFRVHLDDKGVASQQ